MLNGRVVERVALYGVVLACAAFAANSYSKHEQSQKAASDQAAEFAEVQQIEDKENALNVGKILPEGLHVRDPDGRDTDLRTAVAGPTVLLKVAMDCPPCIDTLNWLRKSDLSYGKAINTNILVVAIRSKVPPSGTFPANVHVFYTPDDLSSGFLGGSLTPAEFLFDGQGRLVARRAGYDIDMFRKISFPSALK